MNQLALIFITIIALSRCTDNVKKAFKDSQIVPDVVSVAPEKLLTVEYGKSGKEVRLGNELAPRDVKETPKVEYVPEPTSYYALIMTDPDAPSRKNPTRREWNHWLVVNIPECEVSKGEVIVEYIGACPPYASDRHRYVFLLYKQPGKLNFDEVHRSTTDGQRALFCTEEFTRRHYLGNPVAGNFFQAQYDESVPLIYAQIAETY